MTKELQKTSAMDAGVIEKLALNGDLSELTPQQRVQFYTSICKSLGLNELTQPFQMLKLQGKTVLYATKSCTEQLRKIHGVSVEKLEVHPSSDVYSVVAYVSDNQGRKDAATGAVSLKGLQGEALANAYMKAETKAKRRATLSICGLGMLDESEIESIPGAQREDIATTVVHQVKQVAETQPSNTIPNPMTGADAAKIKSLMNNECFTEDEKTAIEKILADPATDHAKAIRVIAKLSARIKDASFEQK